MILNDLDLQYFQECASYATSFGVVQYYSDCAWMTFSTYLGYVSSVSLAIGQLNIETLPDTQVSRDLFRSICDFYLSI